MMHSEVRLPIVLAVFVLALVAVSAGCGGQRGEAQTMPAQDSMPAQPAEEEPTRDDRPETEVEDRPFGGEDDPDREMIDDDEPSTADEINRSGVLRTIYFPFDSSELSQEARRTLAENAEWIKGHPDYDVVIEGHADERGTIEYNLALGQRRADSVRDYLVQLGVQRGRLRVVSYGEERPEAQGHDERAWSRNRRAVFMVEEG